MRCGAVLRAWGRHFGRGAAAATPAAAADADDGADDALTAWGRHYRTHARDASATELAPWVVSYRAQRRRRRVRNGSVPTAGGAKDAREDDAAIEAVTHLTYDAQVRELGQKPER